MIVERAVELLLAKTLKQRFAQTKARNTTGRQHARTNTDDATDNHSTAKTIAELATTAQSIATAPAPATTPTNPPTTTSANATVPANATAIAAADAQVVDSMPRAFLSPAARVGSVRSSDLEGAVECDVSRVPGNRRYVPRAVLREVYVRDAGQCTFVGANGRRCAERGMLEVHHVRAFARGGCATVGNLALVCRVHNGLFAERDFGEEFMRTKSEARSGLQP